MKCLSTFLGHRPWECEGYHEQCRGVMDREYHMRQGSLALTRIEPLVFRSYNLYTPFVCINAVPSAFKLDR